VHLVGFKNEKICISTKFITHISVKKRLEICVVELETDTNKLITLSSYRAPTGDFNLFIKDLDDTLKYLYKFKAEFLICGDTNTDYVIESNPPPPPPPSLIINNM
jgi:hypothetical protein